MKLKYLLIFTAIGTLYNSIDSSYQSFYELAMHKPEVQVKSLSDLVKIQSPGLALWYHSTPNVRTGNLALVSPITSTWQSLSIADKYSYFAQNQSDLIVKAFEKNCQEIRKLSYEEVLNKLDELKQELKALENKYLQELQKASVEVQQAIKKCGEPLAMTLSTKKPLDAQERFANLMMDLKSLKTQMQIARDAIQECEQRIESYVANAMKDSTEVKSTKDLIEQDTPAAQAEIRRLELKVAQCKDKELMRVERELCINRAKLKYLESVVKLRIETHYTQQRLEDLKELKDNLILLQFDDKQLSKAIDKAIADNGSLNGTVYNALRFPEEDLLKELNIPVEDFKKIYGDALQRALFNQTNNILYTTALHNAQLGSNPHIKEYINATVNMCSLAMDNIHHGTPQEAVVAAMLTEALSKATNNVIGFYKGVAIGAAEGAKATCEFIAHPSKIVTDFKQACTLLVNIANPEVREAISQSIDAFILLPDEKKAEQIGALFGTLMTPSITSKISNAAGLNKALQGLTKLAKVELAGARAFFRVEGAIVKNIYGVAVPEKLVGAIEKLIELKVITKQEHVVEYMERLGLPFFVNCREAIVEVAKDVKAILEREIISLEKLEAAVRNETKMIGTVDNINDALELGKYFQNHLNTKLDLNYAASSLQGDRLNQHLYQLQEYGIKGFKELENGCIRYYDEIALAKTPGPMIGRRLVREWNPITNLKRTWHETIDSNGCVRSIRVETGGPKIHYIFNEQGAFTGIR